MSWRLRVNCHVRLSFHIVFKALGWPAEQWIHTRIFQHCTSTMRGSLVFLLARCVARVSVCNSRTQRTEQSVHRTCDIKRAKEFPALLPRWFRQQERRTDGHRSHFSPVRCVCCATFHVFCVSIIDHACSSLIMHQTNRQPCRLLHLTFALCCWWEVRCVSADPPRKICHRQQHIDSPIFGRTSKKDFCIVSKRANWNSFFAGHRGRSNQRIDEQTTKSASLFVTDLDRKKPAQFYFSLFFDPKAIYHTLSWQKIRPKRE